MLTITHKPLRAALKKMAVLPVLASMVLVFGSKNIVTAQEKKQEKTTAKKQPAGNTEGMRTPTDWVFPGDPPITSATGLSTQQFSEFKHLRDLTIVAPNPKAKMPGRFTGTSSQREKLLEYYIGMNREQRLQSQIAFSKKYAMPAKIVPTEEQFEKWKDDSYYGLWIDGKKADNSTLNNYKASDFSYFTVSRLYYTDKMRENVMKSFNLKKMYKVQLDVNTNANYEKWKSDHEAQPEYTLFHCVAGYDSVKKRPFNYRSMLGEGE